jgi:hypothetical protein
LRVWSDLGIVIVEVWGVVVDEFETHVRLDPVPARLLVNRAVIQFVACAGVGVGFRIRGRGFGIRG